MKVSGIPSALAAVLVILSVLIGCATVRDRDALGPERNWEYRVREQPRIGSPNLETGELRFRDRGIPIVFSELVLFNERYTYRYRTEYDPFQGYRKDPEFDPPEITEAGPELSRRERNRGWYLSELDERRPGTPGGWIWVRRENLSAYLDPREMREFAEYYRLEELSGRHATAEDRRSNVQFRFSVQQSLSR